MRVLWDFNVILASHLHFMEIAEQICRLNWIRCSVNHKSCRTIQKIVKQLINAVLCFSFSDASRINGSSDHRAWRVLEGVETSRWKNHWLKAILDRAQRPKIQRLIIRSASICDGSCDAKWIEKVPIIPAERSNMPVRRLTVQQHGQHVNIPRSGLHRLPLFALVLFYRLGSIHSLDLGKFAAFVAIGMIAPIFPTNFHPCNFTFSLNFSDSYSCFHVPTFYTTSYLLPAPFTCSNFSANFVENCQFLQMVLPRSPGLKNPLSWVSGLQEKKYLAIMADLK